MTSSPAASQLSSDYPQAMADLKAKQYQAALTGFNQVLRTEPTFAPAFLGRAISQFHLGLARAAVTDAQRAVQLQPSLASAQELIGKAQSQLGHSALAISAFKQAAQRYLTATPPDKHRAQACIAQAKQLQQQDQRPPVQIKVDPALSPDHYLHQAKERLESGDPAAALVDLNWLLQLEPDNVDALCSRAEVHQQLSNPTAAAQDMAKAIQLAPDNRDFKLRRACLRLRLGDATGAILELTKLLEPDQPNTEIFLRRAQAHQQLGDWDAAFKDYSNGLGAGVDEPELYQGRAEVRWQTRDLEGAIEDYTHAATLWLNRGKGDLYQKILEHIEQLQQAQTAQVAAETAAQERLIRVPILHHLQGIPVVTAKVEGQQSERSLEMSLSTSSPFTIVPRHIAERLGYTPMGMVWCRSIDGEVREAQTGCVKKIQLGQAIAYFVRIIIAEWETTSYLGQNFFAEYDLHILADEIELHRRDSQA